MDEPILNTIGIKPWLWHFATSTIIRCNMDDSHGMRHFVNTAANVKIILEEFADITIIPGFEKAVEECLLIEAGFVHDLIDGKYMDEQDGLSRLQTLFREHDYSSEHIAIITTIITTMSFSKRWVRRSLGLPLIEPGPLALATAIVVDADQLDGFDPERCRIYQESKYNSKENAYLTSQQREYLCLGWRRTILEKRVLLYKDVYMNTATGKKLAVGLHDKVVEHISRELKDAQLFEYC